MLTADLTFLCLDLARAELCTTSLVRSCDCGAGYDRFGPVRVVRPEAPRCNRRGHERFGLRPRVRCAVS